MHSSNGSRAAADEAALDLASETLYRFLAAALSDPRSPLWPMLFDPASRAVVEQAADFFRGEFADRQPILGFGELPPQALDVRRLIEAADPAAVRSDFQRVFGLVNCRECPPYETEYQPSEDTFFRAQQLADIAGFYRAFGVHLGSTARERPDHVALELEFLALLLTKKRLAREQANDDAEATALAETCEQARRAFFQGHFCWWIPSFSVALRKKAEHGLFEAAGCVLAALAAMERSRLGIKPPPMPLAVKTEELSEECDGCLATCNAS